MASETLSNWGRWGPNDERGTLNLVTAKNVKDSVSLVRHGKVYSLSVELDKNGPLPDIRNPLWHRTSLIERPSPMHSAADDVIVMHTHGTTHIDALCHIFAENQMYNGYRVDESIHPTTGASKNGVQNIVSIVGRGVLLDIAGYRGVDHLESSDEIPPAELDACAQAQGVEIKAGDIVLLRTGWDECILRRSGQVSFQFSGRKQVRRRLVQATQHLDTRSRHICPSSHTRNRQAN